MATREGVARAEVGARVHLLAIGKAAPRMVAAALDALSQRGIAPTGGVIVAAGEDGDALLHPPVTRKAEVLGVSLPTLLGDHPVPGERSATAAEAVQLAVDQVAPGDDVIVLLSGGASALVASPVAEISAADLVELFRRLLRSGADIMAMNAVRKRVLRWGAGRLGAALAAAGARRVHVLLVSDVMGDDIAFIGSGPCTPDTLTAAKVRRLIEREGLQDAIPSAVAEYLNRVHHQGIPETPKPGSSIFGRVEHQVILSNRSAIDAARVAAETAGCNPVRIIGQPLGGDARKTGTELAARLVAWRGQIKRDVPNARGLACSLAGGETTVRMAGEGGVGGRSQELALAAARELHRLRPRSDGIVVLAAGTDGRDGPTDAAGAVVDSSTWSTIAAAGRDAERDLARHDSFHALRAAQALLPARMTGTNVNDLVVGIVDVMAGQI